MLILALDTTTRAGSVAVVRDGVVVHEQSGDPSKTHGQRLPGEVMTACLGAGIEVRDVELFAVAAGPGSFTGLRIGIAAVQGLATAWGRPVAPVSTLEAIAMAAPSTADRIVVWMDAQREEVFAQVFERRPGSLVPTPLCMPISATPDEALFAHAALLHGAEFHGDGAIRYRGVILKTMPHRVVIAGSVPPLAGAIGQLAALEPGRAVLPHAVIPIYVRRPDAEIARDRRSGTP